MLYGGYLPANWTRNRSDVSTIAEFALSGDGDERFFQGGLGKTCGGLNPADEVNQPLISALSSNLIEKPLLLPEDVGVASRKGRAENAGRPTKYGGNDTSTDATTAYNELKGFLLEFLRKSYIRRIFVTLRIAVLVEVDDIPGRSDDFLQLHLVIQCQYRTEVTTNSLTLIMLASQRDGWNVKVEGGVADRNEDC